MDESPLLDPREKEMPRWIQVLAGIALGLFTLLCTVGSLSLLFVKDSPSPTLAKIVGGVLSLACFWVLGKCFRLITGRKAQGRLLGPLALRVVAFFLLVFPVAGFFTGYYREKGPIAIFQAVMYVLGFFGLRALARKREENLKEQKKDQSTP